MYLPKVYNKSMYLYLPEGGDTWRDVETFNEARGNEILTGNFDIVFERKKINMELGEIDVQEAVKVVGGEGDGRRKRG